MMNRSSLTPTDPYKDLLYKCCLISQGLKDFENEYYKVNMNTLNIKSPTITVFKIKEKVCKLL